MDPITIGILAGGGLGFLQGQNNEKKMYQDMMLKSEMAKYAPWSSMANTIASGPGKDLPDQTASLFSGAATGASAGNLFGKIGGGSPGNMGAAGATTVPQQGANALGGQDMAAQLGNQFLTPEQVLEMRLQMPNSKYLAMK